MNRTCIVVVDGQRARFFAGEPAESPRSKLQLVERFVLDNPDLRTLGTSVTGRPRTETNTTPEAVPQRERHRLEVDRRFGQETARQAGEITRDWKSGTVVLIAEPRLLGLIREAMRDALDPGIALKELAKDYAHLTPSELHDHLAVNSLIPAPS